MLPNDAKFPVLFPKAHTFTKLVILKAHRSVLHGGVRETLAEVRQQYWIPQGRYVVELMVKHSMEMSHLHYQNQGFLRECLFNVQVSISLDQSL